MNINHMTGVSKGLRDVMLIVNIGNTGHGINNDAYNIMVSVVQLSEAFVHLCCLSYLDWQYGFWCGVGGNELDILLDILLSRLLFSVRHFWTQMS